MLDTDPDLHLKRSRIRIRFEKNCWIRIRKKRMRIHSLGHQLRQKYINMVTERFFKISCEF